MQKAIRIIALVAVIGLLVGLVIYNTLNPSSPDKSVWNEAMSKGDATTAKHHFIMYTDIFCPYCDKFSNAVAANLEKWEKDYIERENILFEIRVTDVNYENGHSKNSRPAGIAAYCAAKQNNFWDYYYALLAQMFDDYFSKGIGIDPYSQKIPDLPNSYFTDVAKGVKLDQKSFKQCVENQETAKELDKNTSLAQNRINGGVPRFVFDKFTYDGFAGNWDTTSDYEQVKTLMNAGLSTK